MAHKRAQSGRAQIVEIRRPIVDNQVERWFGWRSRRRNDGADCVSKRGGFFQPSEQRRRTADLFRCEIIDYRTSPATDGDNGWRPPTIRGLDPTHLSHCFTLTPSS